MGKVFSVLTLSDDLQAIIVCNALFKRSCLQRLLPSAASVRLFKVRVIRKIAATALFIVDAVDEENSGRQRVINFNAKRE